MRVVTLVQSALLLSAIAIGTSYALSSSSNAPDSMAFATPTPSETPDGSIAIGCQLDEKNGSCTVNSYDCDDVNCTQTSTCTGDAGDFMTDTFGDTNTCEEETSECMDAQCWTCEQEYAGCITSMTKRDLAQKTRRAFSPGSVNTGSILLQGQVRYVSRAYTIRFTNLRNVPATISVMIADPAVVNAVIARRLNGQPPLATQLQTFNGSTVIQLPAMSSISVSGNILITTDADGEEVSVTPMFAPALSQGLPTRMLSDSRVNRIIHFQWDPVPPPSR